MAEGRRVVVQLLGVGVRPELILLGDDVDPGPFAGAGVTELLVAERRVVDRLSDTVHGQGVIAVVARPTPAEVATPGCVLVLDGLADPGNVGTMVRTAAACGADAVVLTAGSADPWSQKAVRSSAGAVVAAPVVAGLSAGEVVGWCQDRQLRVVVTDASGSTDLDQVDPRPPTAWVVGSEAHGVSAALTGAADVVARVPMAGDVESLNAAVVAGIVLHRTVRYRFPTGGGPR